MLISIVLPVYNQADHIEGVVSGYLTRLGSLPEPYELILVTNACTDASPEICARLAGETESVRHIDRSEPGWGGAVLAGLHAAEGELLSYTNSARTTPETLTLTLLYALAYPEVVLKANRMIRDSMVRRVGSLIFNLECRVLFDLAVWDVNGTPKVFPREFGKLLELTRSDDLIDVEFNVVCNRESYPILEVPVLTTKRYGGESTTKLSSAIRMYVGALRLRRRLGDDSR